MNVRLGEDAFMADAPAARRLMETYITDPRMRAQAQQMIDTVPRGAVPMPSGGFFSVPMTVPSPVSVVSPGVPVQSGAGGAVIGTARDGVFVSPNGRLTGPTSTIMPAPVGASIVDPVLRSSPQPLPSTPPPSNARAPDRREER